MRTNTFTYGKTVTVQGILVTKMRGQRQGQVMRDKSKYNRKEKHKSNRDW